MFSRIKQSSLSILDSSLPSFAPVLSSYVALFGFEPMNVDRFDTVGWSRITQKQRGSFRLLLLIQATGIVVRSVDDPPRKR
jgi:hypothetical protein